MKLQITTLLASYLFFCCPLKAQDFNEALPCNINVNGTDWSQNFHIEQRAIFRYIPSDGGACTGTLINQGIYSYETPRQLFLTARHCVRDVNWNGIWRFYFNYQSRNENTLDTPIYNRGIGNNPGQSQDYSSDDYAYYHESLVRVISMDVLTDVALVEILTPIPPHFNIAYAGWIPYFFTGQVITDLPFTVIHHPTGDIKKISRTHALYGLTTPVISAVCNWITGAIDGILGIFRIRGRVRRICRYIEIPFFFVPSYSAGTTQPGSSGAPLMRRNGDIIGTLQGGLAGCVVQGLETYGKFKSAYFLRDFHQALNPHNIWNVDIQGVTKRNRVCYPELNNISGRYFPAADYLMQGNRVQINSQTFIRTEAGVDRLVVFPPAPAPSSGREADYMMRARDFIELNTGFEAQAGSRFEAQVTNIPCSSVATRVPEENNPKIKLPDYKAFDWKKYMPESVLEAFPNPTDGLFTMRYTVPYKTDVVLFVTNLLGEKIADITQTTAHEVGVFEKQIDTKSWKAGMYLYTLQIGEWRETKRFIVK
jgi:hypothetical protein